MTRAATAAPAKLVEGDHTWWQVRLVARRLKITAGRVYHLIADGRLRAREHQGLFYVEERSVARYARYQDQLRHLRTKMTPLVDGQLKPL